MDTFNWENSFNWNSYIHNYPDLIKNGINTQSKAWTHYISFGKNENRTDTPTYKSHPYYTHQPYLKEILKNTTGNILECGCGYGSTVFIKECTLNRTLVTLESDKEWLDKFLNLQSDTHHLYHVDATNDDTNENAKKWVDFIETNLKDISFEVVFLDSSPWLSRKHVYDYFKNKSKIIIIHDFDYFPNKNIIGKTVSKKTFTNFKPGITFEKIEMELNEPGNFRLFYPPDEFFVGETGPPTFVYSNTLSKENFDSFIEKLEIGKYYF